jgi:diguanylate cyclase (GGDEF)-like protein
MKSRYTPLGMRLTLLTVFVVSLITVLALAIPYLIQPSIIYSVPLPIVTVGGASFSALLTGLTLLFLSRRLIDSPLRTMINQIESAHEKDYLLRIPFRAPNTLGELASAINTLMERITTLDAFKLETERALISAQQELKFKNALENKNLHLTLLYDIARMLSEWVHSEDIYHEVLVIVGCMLEYDEMVLMLYDEPSQKLKIAATYGIEESKLIGMEFGVGEGVTGSAIEQKKMIYVPNTRQDDRYLYYKGQKPEDVSFMSVPLLGPSGDKVIGALNVNRPAHEPFQKQDRETLQAVSHLISVAITNAHLYQQLKELSVRDELTGLYNRRYGQETVHREITRAARFGRPLSVLMIDIDHFKRFNDRYGHPMGDIMLKEFSALLNASLRDVDCIIRWGGEEFLIILPVTDLDGALNVAEKLRRNAKQCTFTKLDTKLKPYFAISIGVAAYPDNADKESDLILAVDKALYEAKKTGRDRAVIAKSKTASKKVG